MRKLVLYHGGSCADGFGAAYVAHLHPDFKDAEYLAANYGQPPPDCTGRDTWILDFCYPAEEMEKIASVAAFVRVLDHHPTAKDVAGKYGKFDPEHSGAMMTWLHLFPEAEPPLFIKLIQDRDLWQWKLPFSREFSAGLQILPFDFEVWDSYFKHDSRTNADGASLLIDMGEIILKYQAKVIDSHVKHAGRKLIAGHDVPCVNATTLISEIGHALCQGEKFSASYFDRADGMRIWSLRSAEDGLDVGAIAKSLGGGGHVHASGWQEKLS